jgi:hypothetical protein
MEHHVFISYSRKDADIMRRIHADLQAAELLVWTDESLVPGTESWKNAIENAIQNAGSVVVILTPDSKQSIWVERELDYARACGLPIIPVLARGDNEVSAVPFELINAQRVDIRTDYAENIRSLITAVRDSLDKPGEARPVVYSHGHATHSAYPLPSADTLDPGNFLDHLRLLGWLFLDPPQFLNYRLAHGTRTIRQTGAWLVSDIVWSTFILPMLGFMLGTVRIPGSETGQTTNVLMITAGLLFLGGWFVTARIGWHENQIAGLVLLIATVVLATLMFAIIGGLAGVLFVVGGGWTGLFSLVTIGVAVGAAAGLAFHLANPTVGTLAGLVIAGLIVSGLFTTPVGAETAVAGIFMITLAVGFGAAIDLNLRKGRRSWLGLLMLAALPMNYALMLWMYFLGGWQVLQ